jgi:hypothetical protein
MDQLPQLGTSQQQVRAAAGAPLGVCLLAAAALSGCSGTRFGDQLARSFSAPEPAAAPATGGPGRASTGAVLPTTATSVTSAGATTPRPGTPNKPAAADATAPSPTAAPPGQPAPYRVTLRLPAADSSAPAERVTQALRAAGVSFEVETIERIPAGGDGSGSGGEANSLVTPRRIPAPAPR